jgi:hypothetical protein
MKDRSWEVPTTLCSSLRSVFICLAIASISTDLVLSPLRPLSDATIYEIFLEARNGFY